jgi:hypothetical protein
MVRARHGRCAHRGHTHHTCSRTKGQNCRQCADGITYAVTNGIPVSESDRVSYTLTHPEPNAFTHPEPNTLTHLEPSIVTHPEPDIVAHPEPNTLTHPEPYAEPYTEPNALTDIFECVRSLARRGLSGSRH